MISDLEYNEYKYQSIDIIALSDFCEISYMFSEGFLTISLKSFHLSEISRISGLG